MIQVRRALLSVWDKTGIVEFARGLTGQGVSLVATGNTFAMLEKAGVSVEPVSDVTGFPEILGGRVKTLHPGIFGGILARRDLESDSAQLRDARIGLIDMVVVNLYPFEATIAQPGVTQAAAIEQIDIGGPSMLRAAAKNHQYVVPVIDPACYDSILAELSASGSISRETSRSMAIKVFLQTNAYDAAIAGYLASGSPPESAEVLPARIVLNLQKERHLRYGENPHQSAALYRVAGEGGGLLDYDQVSGKEVSFNNMLDLDAAAALVGEFDEPAVVIIKHTNPCGMATAATQAEAFQAAMACDAQSAFGGIIGLNRPLDDPTAGSIAPIFFEAIVAPGYTEEARARLSKKRNLILLQRRDSAESAGTRLDFKRIQGGLLAQTHPRYPFDPRDAQVVTDRVPTEEEYRALALAWKVVGHVKSNAIVLARADRIVGVGAGQMSRVDSCDIAIRKAGQAGLALQGCVVGSDAFFPFRDSLDMLAAAGITAVIQPGGSIRDDEVIAAANAHQMAMVFAGHRKFRH